MEARTTVPHSTCLTAPALLVEAPFPLCRRRGGDASVKHHCHQSIVDSNLEPVREPGPNSMDIFFIVAYGKEKLLGRIQTSDMADHPSSTHNHSSVVAETHKHLFSVSAFIL